MKAYLFFIATLLFATIVTAQEIAVLQYGGGGDWYSNPTALTNLANFCNKEINTKIQEKTQVVKPDNIDIFDFPFVHSSL